MSRPVFRIDPAVLSAAHEGEALMLSGPEGHHARTVRRLSLGEELDLVDGQGHRGTGEVTRLLADGLEVTLRGPVQAEHGSGLVLVQALAKGDRDLQAIEMATELGVDAVIPWQAERSIVRWKPERAAKSHEKWRRIVEAAAKQCRRAVVPQVFDLQGTEQLADRLGAGERMILLHESATTPLSEVLRPTGDADWDQATTTYVVVGPEGGISEREVQRLRKAGARTARLGPDVLRSSTAGAAALAVIGALGGYWSAR